MNTAIGLHFWEDFWPHDYKDEFIPFIGAIYTPCERLRIDFIPVRPKISYMLTDKVTFSAGAEYHSYEYEVTRQDQQGVVLMFSGVRVGLGLTCKVNVRFKISLSGGRILNQQLRYGDNEGKASIDNGWYMQAGTQIKF